TNRKIAIPMTASTKVNIGVRGLINGYQVTTVKTASVVSGGGGLAPQGEKLIDINFKHYSFAGEVDAINQTGLGSNDAGNHTYDITYELLKVSGRSWDANVANKQLV